MKKLILFILLFTVTVGYSKSMHANWDTLLVRYVTSSGKVNYSLWSSNKDDLSSLNQYIISLSNKGVQSSWSTNKKKAYWINLYNAFTVKIILDSYPIKSIKDIDKGNVWNTKQVISGVNSYTLNDIENKILRTKYKDARVHFIINCGAISCPKLLNKSITESNIETMLNKATKTFVNNTSFNIITAEKIKISKIFEWYNSDFVKNGSLIDFLNIYSKVKINAHAKIEYITYKWGLNTQ